MNSSSMKTRGRSFQECFSSLSDSGKQKESDEDFTASKRSRVIAEISPFVFSTAPAPAAAAAAAAAATATDDETQEIPAAMVSKKRTDASAGASDENDDSEKTRRPIANKLANEHNIDCLKRQKELVAKDIQIIEEKRRNIFTKQRELWGMYRYGLEKISKLTDLRDAPDALLPGNF
jgi:hypothetical protein